MTQYRPTCQHLRAKKTASLPGKGGGGCFLEKEKESGANCSTKDHFRSFSLSAQPEVPFSHSIDNIGSKL
jgi:hypothetical protein